MSSSYFRWQILAQLALLVLTLWLALRLDWATAPVSAIGVFLVLVVQIYVLFSFITRSHERIVNFLQTLAYEDVSGCLTLPDDTRVGRELRDSMNNLRKRVAQLRQTNEEQMRYYAMLLEQVPTPLFVLKARRLGAVNLAAQKLLRFSGELDAQQLKKFGTGFAHTLLNMKPGDQHLLQLDGEQQNISLLASISQLKMSGEVSSLISLQPIQQQLDAYEINAWQKLVQVFTHEIMNSMTPVTSLGNTAQALLAEAQQGELPPSASERIEDARQAMHTLNRRTDHLMKFVQAYQRIANPPRLQRQPLDIARLFEHVGELFADQTQAKGVRLVSQVIPMNLQFSLDGVQLEQALINLLKNSLEALAQKQEALGNNFCAEIVLRASLGQQSNLVIDIEDNGVGVDESKRDQIFVPFYTSKPEGSGIGLYLVKQIVQAHGGSVRALPRAGGGAVFRLAFY